MRYLFFDIECCDGKHICSYGYAICDTDFNLLKKEDILINPEAEFKLSKSGFNPNIELAYEEEEFKKASTFPYAYDFIKQLLSDGDQIICGHAVSNDAIFLKTACSRYELPQLSYYFADSQKIYHMLGAKANFSLEKIADILNVEIASLHKSDEDAYLTMLVVKRICEVLKLSLKQIIEICPAVVANTQDGMIKRNNQSSYKILKAKVKTLVKQEGDLSGTKIAFSENLEKNYTIIIWSLITEIVRRGGEYTNMAQDANIFVRSEGIECKRLRSAHANGVKVVELFDFAKSLDMDFSLFQFQAPTKKQEYKKTTASVGDILKGRIDLKILSDIVDNEDKNLK